jgi:hypothetical protein
MKLVTVHNGYVIPTLWGKFVTLMCIPLFIIAGSFPRLYKRIYMKFLKGNWYRLVIFINLHK